MIKKFLKIKGVLALILVTAFSMSTMGAVVSDNDGAAFVTKAEFDALKKNFKSQIENYNNSIDNKVDGAIAAYLAGIKFDRTTNIQIKPYVKQLTFIDGPQWLVHWYGSRLTSARTWWGSSKLSGLSTIHYNSSNTDLKYGVIPLSAKPFSVGNTMSLYNIGIYDSGSSGSISFLGASRNMFYKVTVQDDWREFWYVALQHALSVTNTALQAQMTNEAWRPWAVVTSKSGYWILRDFQPYLYFYPGNVTVYGNTNYFLDQVNWQFADPTFVNSAGNAIRLSMNWTGQNFINFCMSFTGGTTVSVSHSVAWSRFAGMTPQTNAIGGIGYYSNANANVFSANSTLFGGVVSGYSGIPVLLGSNMMSFAGATYNAFSWGSTSLFTISGQLYKYQNPIVHPDLSASYNSKFNYWNAWSSTSARVAMPAPYSYLSLMSFRNNVLFNNGYSDVGLCDGLPLCEVMENGYAEIRIKCSTWRTARRRSWSGTSYSWLSTINRSDDSAKEWKSTLLHISTSKFNNVAGNSSTLKLCDSAGIETSAYAQSIGNSHSYNYNLSYNASASRSENEYNVWKVYVPVKMGDTIYVKFEPKDTYGLTGVRIVDASVVIHSEN